MTRWSTLVGLVAVFAPYMAATYLANNVGDRVCDAINPRKLQRNPVAKGELSDREALAAAVLLAILGAVAAALLFPVVLPVYVTAITLSLAYSLPPRLKCRPVLDIVSHSLFFGLLLVLMGAMVAGEAPDLITLLLFAVYSAFLEVRNELEDLDYDAAALCTTTVARLGRRKALILARALAAGSVALAAIRVLKMTWAAFLAPLALALYFWTPDTEHGARVVDLYVAATVALWALGGV